MINFRIFYIIFVFYAILSSAYASSKDDNTFKDPQLSNIRQQNNARFYQQSSNDYITYQYESSLIGTRLLSSCYKDHDSHKVEFSYLFIFVGSLPEYCDKNSYQYFALNCDEKYFFDYYYRNYNDPDEQLFEIFKQKNLNSFATNPLLFVSIYLMEKSLNRNRLIDAALKLDGIRQNFIDHNNPITINRTIHQESVNIKSLDELALFIKEQQPLLCISDCIDNNDINIFNRFWKNLNVNMSTGKKDFVHTQNVDEIRIQFTAIQNRLQTHARVFTDLSHHSEKINSQSQILLDQLDIQNDITVGRRSLNAINQFKLLNFINLNSQSVENHTLKLSDGIICITSCQWHHNKAMITNLKNYQIKYPERSIFWLAHKYMPIPTELITSNFYVIPGNPQKLLPQLYDELVKLHTAKS